jgi:hypothetical protein
VVGVTGFEPATSSSRTPRESVIEDHSSAGGSRWTLPRLLSSMVAAVLRCCTPDCRLHTDARAPQGKCVGAGREAAGSIMFTIPWPRREGSSLCYRALAVLAFGRRRHRRLLPPFGLDCDVERAWSGARHRRNRGGAIRHLASRSAAGVCTRLSRRVLTGQTWSTMVRTNCS